MENLEESLEKTISFPISMETTKIEGGLFKHLEKEVKCYFLYSLNTEEDSLRGTIKLIDSPEVLLIFKTCRKSIDLEAPDYGKEVREGQLRFIADLERTTKRYFS